MRSINRVISGIMGLSLAISTFGCGGAAPSSPEELGQTSDALYYRHVWNVYSMDNGVRHDYYSPDDVAELTGLGFPLQMWDSGSSPSTNSGTICAMLPSTTPGGSSYWRCISSNNFAGDNFISTEGGLSEYPKDIHLRKPINSGNWSADWGTGGPGYSYIYYATYGQ